MLSPSHFPFEHCYTFHFCFLLINISTTYSSSFSFKSLLFLEQISKQNVLCCTFLSIFSIFTFQRYLFYFLSFFCGISRFLLFFYVPTNARSLADSGRFIYFRIVELKCMKLIVWLFPVDIIKFLLVQNFFSFSIFVSSCASYVFIAYAVW